MIIMTQQDEHTIEAEDTILLALWKMCIFKHSIYILHLAIQFYLTKAVHKREKIPKLEWFVLCIFLGTPPPGPDSYLLKYHLSFSMKHLFFAHQRLSSLTIPWPRAISKMFPKLGSALIFVS